MPTLSSITHCLRYESSIVGSLSATKCPCGYNGTRFHQYSLFIEMSKNQSTKFAESCVNTHLYKLYCNSRFANVTLSSNNHFIFVHFC